MLTAGSVSVDRWPYLDQQVNVSLVIVARHRCVRPDDQLTIDARGQVDVLTCGPERHASFLYLMTKFVLAHWYIDFNEIQNTFIIRVDTKNMR